eukprot:s5799_g3.t3
MERASSLPSLRLPAVKAGDQQRPILLGNCRPALGLHDPHEAASKSTAATSSMRSMTFLQRVLLLAWLPSLVAAVITQANRRVLVDAGGLLHSQLQHCAKLPPRMMVHSPVALLSSADDGFVRFVVTKTRSDRGKVEFAELVLEDAAGQPIDLSSAANVIQARLEGPSMLETPGSVDLCIDGKLETSCLLEVGQNIVLQLQPGHQVGSYGFKTALENSTEVRACDPIAFKMERSQDGSVWRESSVKAAVDVPNAGGFMVGPFLLSGFAGGPVETHGHIPPMIPKDLPTTTAARQLPANVMSFTTTTPPPPPAAAAPEASPPAPMAVVEPQLMLSTSTTPITDVPADAPSRVATAVIDAAERAGMPLPQRMAAATAAAAAAKTLAKPVSKEAIAEAAAAAGLDTSHLQAVNAALAKAAPERLPALLALWNAAADAARHAAERGPEKVSHVVEAAAAAGLSIEQQAQAAAAAAVAAVASMTTPSTLTGPEAMITAVVKAAEEAGMALDKQSDMAAVMQEQDALLHILHAAEILPRTTPAPEEVPEFDGSSPAAKTVADTITQVIRDIPVSPQQKLQVVSSAARAAQVAAEHSSTTTSFDGVRMVVEAAEAAGIKDAEKLQKVQEKAEELSPEKQKAAVRTLEAAADDQTPSTTAPHAAAKVAAVVKAAADSGMTEEQQAEVAAAAAAAVSKAAEPAPKEGQVSELIKVAKSLGLGDSELEAILASAVSPKLSPLSPPKKERRARRTKTCPSLEVEAAAARQELEEPSPPEAFVRRRQRTKTCPSHALQNIAEDREATTESIRLESQEKVQALRPSNPTSPRTSESGSLPEAYASAVQTPSTTASLPGMPNIKSWRCGSTIGQGSYGTVCRALDTENGFIFCVKKSVVTEDDEEGQKYIQKLREELDILRSLRHPNIICCYGHEYCSDTLYIFMEFAEGGSLATMLKEFGALDGLSTSTRQAGFEMMNNS